MYKRQTLRAEKTRGGTVKARRLGPPRRICFLTVDIIWKENSNLDIYALCYFYRKLSTKRDTARKGKNKLIARQ